MHLERETYYSKAGRMESAKLVRLVVSDFEDAEQARSNFEDRWLDDWMTYLSESDQEDEWEEDEGQAVVKGPHGGMTIRLLVPLVKKIILSTWPFIHSRARKEELRVMEPLLDKQMGYWMDAAKVRQIVLTSMLKEAFIFGAAFGKVTRVVQVAPQEVSNTALVDGEIVEQKTEVDKIIYAGPKIIPIPIEEAYIDASARSFDEAAFAIHRFFRTKSQLEADPAYKTSAVRAACEKSGTGTAGGPPLDDLFSASRRAIVAGLSMDEMTRRVERLHDRDDDLIEVMELVSGGRLVSVLNRKTVGRNGALDATMPWFSLVPDPIPGEIYGKSAYHDARSSMEQRDFLTARTLENVANIVAKMFKGMPGLYDPATIRSRPGGVVHVTNMKAFDELQQTDIVGSIFALLTQKDKDIERATGISEILGQVGAGAGTSYPETATVGTIKQDNALLFVGEMVSQIEENGLKRLARILFDIESEYVTKEDWIRLAGEEGARWRSVSLDSMAEMIDFQAIGSAYEANKRAEGQATVGSFDRILEVYDRDPQGVNIRKALLAVLRALSFPNPEVIVPEEPRDQGPEAEHEVMQQGMPVVPTDDEDLNAHIAAHAKEIERFIGTIPDPAAMTPEDLRYMNRLMDHIKLTQSKLARMQAAAKAYADQSQNQQGAPASSSSGGGKKA